MKEGSAQHAIIVEEALLSGMRVENHSTEAEQKHVLRRDDQAFTLIQGVIQEWTNPKATRYCDEKQLTKEMLEALKLPHPKSVRFYAKEELPATLFESGQTYICKPEVSTNGIGVAFDIHSLDDVENYLASQQNPGPFLIEDYLEGHDLRIQAIGGKMVAACTRQPAEVFGNGKDTLEKLIDIKRAAVIQKNSANRLDVDQETLGLLKQQKISLDTVPAEGQSIRLKRIANMAQGATAVDCTEEIHPEIQAWIDALATFLQAPCFAIDIITPDIRDIGQYKILELNLRAEWMHHTFSEVRQHNLAKTIIEELQQY